jgi:hypothetical protein
MQHIQEEEQQIIVHLIDKLQPLRNHQLTSPPPLSPTPSAQVKSEASPQPEGRLARTGDKHNG